MEIRERVVIMRQKQFQPPGPLLGFGDPRTRHPGETKQLSLGLKIWNSALQLNASEMGGHTPQEKRAWENHFKASE